MPGGDSDHHPKCGDQKQSGFGNKYKTKKKKI